MKYLIAILLTLYVNSAKANNGDKILHTGGSALSMLVFYNLFPPKWSHEKAYTGALMATLLLGLGKELTDQRIDPHDIGANVAGMAIGSMIIHFKKEF